MLYRYSNYQYFINKSIHFFGEYQSFRQFISQKLFYLLYNNIINVTNRNAKTLFPLFFPSSFTLHYTLYSKTVTIPLLCSIFLTTIPYLLFYYSMFNVLSSIRCWLILVFTSLNVNQILFSVHTHTLNVSISCLFAPSTKIPSESYTPQPCLIIYLSVPYICSTPQRKQQ